MKRVLLFICLFVTFSRIVSAHGFGIHMAHYPDVLALNDGYRVYLEDPRYKPYFLYGSIFPDIQYASNYKTTLSNLYQKIRDFEYSGVKVFEGLQGEISLDQIPDAHFPLGMDTHDEKYAMQFAEYLLNQAQSLRSDVMKFGTGADQANMQMAFALGYICT